jgi:hypothetical protein
MPFKDIDLEKVIKQNAIENELRKKVAINNKLNTTTLDGFRDKVNAIELVSGRKYELPSFDQRVSQEESLLPITSQLDKLQKQIANTPVTTQQQQIEYRNPDAEFLRDTYRLVMGEDLRVGSREDITNAIQRIGHLKREVADKQSEEYRVLYDLSEYLKGYRSANFPQPYQQRSRAESRLPRPGPSSRRRLPSAPPSINIESLEEQEGEGLFTSFNEIFEKLKVLIGEISSGNKNIKLKNEANDILEFLLRAKKISKNQYTKSMNLISNL